jgi:hypothetical protein
MDDKLHDMTSPANRTLTRDDPEHGCRTAALAPTLSVGVLSYHAHETLARTLDSYEKGALASCAKEACIFFNGQTEDDLRFARNYPDWRCTGTPDNLGILGGTDALARTLAGDYLLMLQNDCPLVADAAFTSRYLAEAVELLASGRAHVVRCRSRSLPGQGFADKKKFERFYGHGWRSFLWRVFRPIKARRAIGRAPYAIPDADSRFPSYITRHGNFLIVDSEVMNFTDQPFLISRSLMITLLDWAKDHPRGRPPALEVCLNTSWWRDRHFKVAVGEGLFTHARIKGAIQ